MEVTAEKWTRVKALFDLALQQEPSARSSFLDSAVAEQDVRALAKKLLRAHHQAGNFLGCPAYSPQLTSQADTKTLNQGHILARRFLITRFIEKGGAGEVYEATDLELQQQVAIKTIRPDILAQPKAQERFKREVSLAKQVTHPNICRIFDLFRHQDSPGEADVIFISMELLRGETLANKLRRSGRMSRTEALPIIIQMASALEAAHKVGVVHRDFKPGNVVLVPNEDTGELRAVVTDFGMAIQSGADLSVSLTPASVVAGTPAYMSPEQVEGQDATAASDIYSLGLVIYQMVTGSRPFEAESPISMALKRLKETPAPPSRLVPDLDRPWERVILKCLERRPESRFGAANEVAKALSGEAIPGRRSSTPIKLLATLLTLLLMATIGTFVLRLHLWRPKTTGVEQPTVNPMRPRRSVVVFGLKNLSGETNAQWLSTAISEMLTSELAAGEILRTIPGESAARTKIDLAIPDSDSFAPDSLKKIARNLSVDFVVVGSYLAGATPNSRVRVDLHLQDATTGETIATEIETGTSGDIFALVARLGAHLRERLGAGEVSSAQGSEVLASLPSDPEAAQFYSEGLSKLRFFDDLRARDLLEQAVVAEPKFALAHSGLATAWSDLGYDSKAKQEAKNALDLSPRFSKETRLSIEARYHEMVGEWQKAIGIYQQLSTDHPDVLEYGLRLADAQMSSGRGKEALQTIATLRRGFPQSAGDGRLDLAESEAARAISDFHREQMAAAEAAKKGDLQGARLLVAKARLSEGWAWYRLGDPTQAASAAQEAKSIYTSTGDFRGVARALNNLGALALEKSDYAAAKRTYEEFLAVSRDTGDQQGQAMASINIGIVLELQGELAAAKKMYQKASAIWRGVGDKEGAATVSMNIAAILAKEGELDSALRVFEDAVNAYRQFDNKQGISEGLDWIGDVLYDKGELDEAQERYSEALGMFREIGLRSDEAYAIFGIGNILFARGDLPGARGKHEEALALRKGLGEEGALAESYIALARTLIEQGDPGQAEAAAREAMKALQSEKGADKNAIAYSILARSLLAEGKVEEAQKAAAQADTFLAKEQNCGVRLFVGLTDARVVAASGMTVKARRQLVSAMDSAKNHGFVGYEFEARLALGQLEMENGQPMVARPLLERLEKDASKKGFGLIARKAATTIR